MYHLCGMRGDVPKVRSGERYSLKEAAYYLGVSRQTLYRWRTKGAIDVGKVKVNGDLFITGEEILRVWKETF